MISENEESSRSLAPYLLRPPRRWNGALPPEAESGVVADVFAVLRRQWKTILGTLVAAMVATTLYCLIITPSYLGQSTVQIEGKGPELLTPEDSTAAQSPFVSTKYDYYQTQFTLLRSPLLVQRVMEELDLPHDSRFVVPGSSTAAPSQAHGSGVNPQLMSQYLKLLTIYPVRGTRLVYIQFLSPDANLAADIANAHARIFVRMGMERLYNAMDQIRTFLQGKLVELQSRMQEAETNLARFQSTHNLMPLDISKDVASERLVDLSKHLTVAEGNRIEAEAQYQLVKDHHYDSLPAVLGSPLIQKLREDTDRLEVDHALLAMKFRPSYPRLKQVDGQLDHARKLLKQETDKVVRGVEANYHASQTTVEQLKLEIEAQRRALLGRKDAEGEFLTLVREVETTRAIHDNLLARIKNLNVSGGADASNISVVEPATPAPMPYSPAWKLDLLISFAAGLILGSGIAFLRDAGDLRIRDARDIQRHTGLGTLAIVPDFDLPLGLPLRARLRAQLTRTRRLASDGLKRLHLLRNGHDGDANGQPVSEPPPLLLGNGSTPPPAEAYRTLRTSLLLSRSVSPRVILIASAVGTEGKTTTAVNTAAALASCGATVLLIDADLRLARCHAALGVPADPGLSDYLTGQVDTLPIQETHVENLSLLAAGQQVQNPSELLTSWKMCKLLQDARERFDFIVLDSPPLLVVSDGLLLANLADGVVFVADKGRSRRDQMRIALQRLHQAGAVPLGAVLNRGNLETKYYRYHYTGPLPSIVGEILPPQHDDPMPGEDVGQA